MARIHRRTVHNPDNHDGVITDLEPDILECEVKWALGSITTNKASGGDGIPVELFQILRDDAVKVLHLICQQIWKTQQWPQDWKRSVFIPIPKKGNAKECSNYHTIALISHASQVMLKILQEMGIPDHLTCLLRNLYAGQEATVRTGHGTIDWFQIGKGVGQGCLLSPCLFNSYAEYIMRNAGLEEAQAGIKIDRRNINNLNKQMTPPLWQKAMRN